MNYYENRTHVSQSELKAMHKNPQEFNEIRCGRLPKKPPSDDMKLGNILHCRLLEPHLFNERYATMPAFEFDAKNTTDAGKPSTSKATKYYKQKSAEWIDANKGKEFVDEETIAQVDFMIDAIKSHTEASELVKCSVDKEFEREIYTEFRGVKIRGKLDILDLGQFRIPDLKKTKSAEPKEFGKSVIEYGYDIQLAMYLTLVELGLGVTIPPEDYYFIKVEENPPYRVGVECGHDDMLKLGQQKLNELLDEYKYRTESNDWLKSWQTGIIPVQLPKYAFYQNEVVYE